MLPVEAPVVEAVLVLEVPVVVEVPVDPAPDVVPVEPVVVVEYKREHFASACGQLRITIDYDITFYRQFGHHQLRMEFPQRLPRVAVLEGKTPVGMERELRALLYPLTLRSGRCSKYVHGCQQLGLVDL